MLVPVILQLYHLRTGDQSGLPLEMVGQAQLTSSGQLDGLTNLRINDQYYAQLIFSHGRLIEASLRIPQLTKVVEESYHAQLFQTTSSGQSRTYQTNGWGLITGLYQEGDFYCHYQRGLIVSRVWTNCPTKAWPLTFTNQSYIQLDRVKDQAESLILDHQVLDLLQVRYYLNTKPALSREEEASPDVETFTYQLGDQDIQLKVSLQPYYREEHSLRLVPVGGSYAFLVAEESLSPRTADLQAEQVWLQWHGGLLLIGQLDLAKLTVTSFNSQLYCPGSARADYYPTGYLPNLLNRLARALNLRRSPYYRPAYP